jgi:DNA-binding PadR family transcriptional regulator
MNNLKDAILTSDISYAIIAMSDIAKSDIVNGDPDLMGNRDEIDKYLPLTEATCYILLSLVEPLHGYALMQKVEAMSQRTVKIGPGTLYGAFNVLEKEGLIVKVDERDRRKSYVLTAKGKKVLQEQVRRSEILVRNGIEITKGW